MAPEEFSGLEKALPPQVKEKHREENSQPLGRNNVKLKIT